MAKFVVCAAFLVALVLPAAASAEPPNGGGYCGASANGCEAAAEAEAQCGSGGGSGAFGAFGTYGYIHDFRGGADGQQTGRNNAALCGNRPGQPVDRPRQMRRGGPGGRPPSFSFPLAAFFFYPNGGWRKSGAGFIEKGSEAFPA